MRNHKIFCVGVISSSGVRGSGIVTRKRAWRYIKTAQGDPSVEMAYLYEWAKDERMPKKIWEWARKERSRHE